MWLIEQQFWEQGLYQSVGSMTGWSSQSPQPIQRSLWNWDDLSESVPNGNQGVGHFSPPSDHWYVLSLESRHHLLYDPFLRRASVVSLQQQYHQQRESSGATPQSTAVHPCIAQIHLLCVVSSFHLGAASSSILFDLPGETIKKLLVEGVIPPAFGTYLQAETDTYHLSIHYSS